jgi:hypothetical protein
MKTFGTLVTKALARFHSAPALTVLILVAASPETVVSAVPCSSAKSVAATLRVVGPVAEVETVSTILSLWIPESLLDITRSGVAN